LVRILATDPGLATGIAIYNTDTLKVEYVNETANGIYGYKPVFKELNGDGFRNPYGITHVACENFTLRSSNKFTADLHGVEIIGWLKGENQWGANANPEPSQHMTLTRLRQKKDNYADSVITKMMKDAGFKIGKGHTRMALSVAVWYAAMRLKHIPTLEMLKAKENSVS
jgi:hypothetical protein